MWKETVTKVDRRVVLVRVMALVLVMLTLMLAAYLYGLSQSPAGVPEEDRESVALYVEAMRAIQEDYVDQEEIDPEEQTYSAIEGMIDSLGDEGHTRFLAPDEVEKSREAISSTYVGIGVRLEDKDDEVVVQAPLDGSPAEEAGIKSGDVLIAVDVERAELEVPVASWNFIPGTDVAHLRLSSFSENSAEKLEETLAEAREAGARRFILDLRDNPGGLVEQAEEVAAQFLPAGSGVYIRRDADGREEETFVQ